MNSLDGNKNDIIVEEESEDSLNESQY